jgi:hypothetical protein
MAFTCSGKTELWAIVVRLSCDVIKNPLRVEGLDVLCGNSISDFGEKMLRVGLAGVGKSPIGLFWP